MSTFLTLQVTPAFYLFVGLFLIYCVNYAVRKVYGSWAAFHRDSRHRRPLLSRTLIFAACLLAWPLVWLWAGMVTAFYARRP